MTSTTPSPLDVDVATKVRDLPLGDLAAINNSFGFSSHRSAAVVLTNAFATPAR